MKSITTILFILFAIVIFFACNKLKDCITYPEDTVAICGKTHTWISGKTWDLDSVILNGKNITQQVWDSLGANSYGFNIFPSLDLWGLTAKASTSVIIGSKGYEAFYVKETGIGQNVDVNMYFSVVGQFGPYQYSNVPVAGLYGANLSHKVRIREIRQLKPNSLKLRASFNDTLIENYFSVK